jgi:sugar (pentulose or hexulose) kinase
VDAEQVVLSGNLFLDSTIAPLIASLVPAKVLRPPLIGQATLRGAAVYGWRALGHDAKGALESLLANAQTVERMNDNALRERYERFKQARASKLPTVRK